VPDEMPKNNWRFWSSNASDEFKMLEKYPNITNDVRLAARLPNGFYQCYYLVSDVLYAGACEYVNNLNSVECNCRVFAGKDMANHAKKVMMVPTNNANVLWATAVDIPTAYDV